MVLKPPLPPARMDPTKMQLEVDIFGLSYHTNRNYDFNETNTGLGLSLVMQSKKKPAPWFNVAMVGSVGTYEDSYYDQAFYALCGPRAILGYDDSFHASVAIQAGFLKGSDVDGAIAVPFVTVGYDRYSLGITGDPVGRKGDDTENSSKMIAVFLKIRVLDF